MSESRAILDIRPRSAYYLFIALQYFALTLTASNGSIYILSRAVSKPWLGYLSTLGALAVIIFEFPTGVFADRCGRGLSISISFALRGSAQLVMAFALGPLWFGAAAVLGAVGFTFFSGASEAWIFSRDPSANAEGGRLYADAALASGAAKLIGGGVGAALATWRPQVPFLVAGAILLFASAAFAWYDWSLGPGDVPPPRSAAWSTEVAATASAVLSDTGLAALTWTGVFFIVFCSVPLLYWQPFFFERQSSLLVLGGVYCGLIAATMGGNLLAKSAALGRIEARRVFTGGMVLCGLALGAAAVLGGSTMSVVAFLAYHFFLGIVGPFRGKLLNERIPSARRAGMLSFVSFAESAGGMTAGLAAGYLSSRLPLSAVFLIALVPLVAALVVSLRLPQALGPATSALLDPVS